MKKKESPMATKRVTFVLPEVIDRALEQHCSVTNRPEHEVAAEAITIFLTKHRQALIAHMHQTNEKLQAAAGRLNR
jgi:predicted transcriptional regulator